MLDNFELRFVKREVAGRHIVSDIHEAVTVKILQYRTRELHSTYNGDWTEWEDIPVDSE